MALEMDVCGLGRGRRRATYDRWHIIKEHCRPKKAAVIGVSQPPQSKELWDA